MYRRALVGRLAALAACGVLAGCSNNQEVPVTAPENPVESDGGTPAPTVGTGRTSGGEGTPRVLVVRGWDASGGPEGELVVTVTVHNPARSARTALVRVVAGAGSEEFTGERFVSLDGGEQTTVELPFPVAYDRFDADPSLSFDVIPRTPETPLPVADAVTTLPDQGESGTDTRTDN